MTDAHAQAHLPCMLNQTRAVTVIPPPPQGEGTEVSTGPKTVQAEAMESSLCGCRFSSITSPKDSKFVNEIYFVVVVFNFKQNQLFGITKARNLYFVLLKRNISFSHSSISKSQSDKESQMQ